MKILVFSNLYFPQLSNRRFLGGVERFVEDVHLILRKRGHESSIFVTKDSNLEVPGIIRLDCNSASYSRSIGEKSNLSEVFKKKLEEISGQQFDFIISNFSDAPAGKLKLMSQFFPSSKIVHIFHGVPEGPKDFFSAKSALALKESIPNLRTYAVSQFLKDVLHKTFGDNTIDGVLPLDYPEIDLGYEEHPEDYYVHHGRICRWKNSDLLLDVFERLGDKKLKIYGSLDVHDPVYAQQFKERVEKMSNVTVNSPSGHDELFPVIKKSKAVLIPSLYETFCFSAFEAQKLGVPVVIMNPLYRKVNNHGALQYATDKTAVFYKKPPRTKKEAVIEGYVDAIKKSEEIDRGHVYSYMQENFGEEKFYKSLEKILS